ncbi:Pentatricopeptide repeat-containing protein [Thalictrum thalictroides]|uniref:Pentatricopeptide repeat-containing protein n=1 Tax=Thalictrum thalictroides TaxID=46969 RepID=A0A7J6X637_THATH|nr:Pentatricopeptide repeat-containing protein [Thalictrum thalictroides]
MSSCRLYYFNFIPSFSTFNHHHRYCSSRLLFSAVHNKRKSNGHDSSDLLLLQSLSQRRLQEARDLLDEIPQRDTRGSSNVVIWTSLLSKYARDGYVDEARTLFELMPVRNVVTHNAMLSAYVQSGRINEACQVFDKMPERNVVSWTSMLSGLTSVGRIGDAKNLFNYMPEKNVVSWNAMMVGLIRNGDLAEARRLFDIMPVRNLISWNIVISGYVENNNMGEARVLFDAMLDPNIVTWTSLIAGYCRAGDVEEGYQMFRRMPDRNIVSWTAMIGGFTWNGFYDEALSLFLEMKGINNMRPNGETFISLVYACSGLCYPGLGKQIHAQLIIHAFENDDYDGRLSKSLIHMYCEFAIMGHAHNIFSKYPYKQVVQSCNSMIKGYIRIGLLEKARKLFNAAPNRDKISWTSMITGYFHAGNVCEASCLFDRMMERDSIAWTVMIAGNVQNELFAEAIYYFMLMRIEGVEPLEATYSTLIGAAGAIANIHLGKQLLCLLLKTKSKLDLNLENSLISMYSKCGELDEACRLFSDMQCRDIVSWNSMIMGFSHHGLVKEALELFDVMQETGIHPNSITFLGVLSACSHAGWVDQGWELFNSMSQDGSVVPGPEHYVCMVDLLGRAGKVVEAAEFVMKLPFEPGPSMWGALLGVCGLGEMNADIAKLAAQRVLELDPTNAPAHVLLCNIYAAAGQHGQGGMLRKAMRLKGVRKIPGCSWIFLKGKSNVFLSGDRSHPEANVIVSLLQEIVGVTKWCLNDINVLE